MKRLTVLLFVAHGLLAQSAGSRGLRFTPLAPCRTVDAQVVAGTPLPVTLRAVCGVPRTAKAVSLMLTISAPTADGSYTLDTFPAVEFVAGETISSCGTVVPVLSTTISAGQARVYLDVSGYWQ